jgi:hypothetical protein
MLRDQFARALSVEDLAAAQLSSSPFHRQFFSLAPCGDAASGQAAIWARLFTPAGVMPLVLPPLFPYPA